MKTRKDPRLDPNWYYEHRDELDVEDRIVVGLHAENLDVRVGKGHDRPLRRREIPEPAAGLRPTVRRVLEDGIRRKQVGALSKGYCRRLMLALALIAPQPLLLMDEPFDGFDLRQTREIMGVLREVAGDRRTLVLAVHQLLDAERVCDRFVLLVDGRIRGAGTLAELRARTGLAQAGLEEVFLALT